MKIAYIGPAGVWGIRHRHDAEKGGAVMRAITLINELVEKRRK